MSVSRADLAELLGPPRFVDEAAMRVSVPGVATGLAWTPVGGDILFIEATKTPGHGKLIRRDYEDIPLETRAHLEFVWLERVDDTAAAAFEAQASAETLRPPGLQPAPP